MFTRRAFLLVLVILSMVLIRPAVHALENDPFKGPKPIAVLIEVDPWLNVIGSDTPMVAIYNDGQVIYMKKDAEEPILYHKQLSPDAFVEIKKELSAFGNHPKPKRDYSLTSMTDQLTANIYFSLDGTEFVTSVYGLTVSDIKPADIIAETVWVLEANKAHPDAEAAEVTADTKITIEAGGHMILTTNDGQAIRRDGPYEGVGGTFDMGSGGWVFEDRGVFEDLPVAIQNLYIYLTSLDFADAKPWEPAYVEAMIWGYNHATGESIHWPKDWPGLSSPSTLKRGDSYSIFFPGEKLSELRQFLNTEKQGGAVEIDGKKWAVSVRYTFPSEPVWFKAFRR